MKPLFILGAIVSLLVTMPSHSWAAANLNSLKSNIYRLIYDTAVVSPDQAAAILADFDKENRGSLRGPLTVGITESQVKEIMKKHGVVVGKVKKIVILPPDATDKETTIFLLANPEDEAQALAVKHKPVIQGDADIKNGSM